MGTQPDSLYYFISYSRQEVTFVDSFSRELEKRGIHSWVDFRNLVPGSSWQTQLDDGVHNAAAILLVVSKASMSSGPVKDEWTKSLAAGRRIILIAFEPSPIDPGLAGLEWVDFTTDFEKGLNDLQQVLVLPKQTSKSTLPATGLPLPGTVKKFIWLSRLAVFLSLLGTILFISVFFSIAQAILAAGDAYENTPLRNLILGGLLASIFVFWIPAFLNFQKLPKQVRYRTHHAEKIKSTVNGLVYANLFLLAFILSGFIGIWDAAPEVKTAIADSILLGLPLMVIIFAVCLWIYRVMISAEMYRWAGPTGALVHAKRPDLTGHLNNGQPLKIGVEFAPQDRNYAEALKAAIVKAGHLCTDNFSEADVILPLISTFKSGSICDPQRQRVLPILLQTCDVDPALSKMQWVDLRYGKDSIDAVANLLDEPDAFLRTLGLLPIRMTILPEEVKRVVGALTAALSFSIAMLIINLIMMMGDNLFLLVLTTIGLYLLRRNLIIRKFWVNKSRVKTFYAYGAKKSLLSGFVRMLEKNPKILEMETALNHRLGKIDITYPWLLAGSVVVAILVKFSGWVPLETAYLVWIIPLLMLSKEVRMWLPISAK
jgi:hypothetical protein